MIREAIAIVLVLALGAVLVPVLLALPAAEAPSGAMAAAVEHHAVADTHAHNLVAAVLFDYRGLDTLVESFILFTAAMGAGVLLAPRDEDPVREGADPRREAPAKAPPAVRLVALAVGAFLVLLGLSMAVHGHLTPGGGFQGGVVLGGTLVLVYLAAGYRAFHRLVQPKVVHAVEGLALAGFVGVGLVGLSHGAYLANPLPLGTPGELLSGGAIPVLNGLVAVAVGAAVARLAVEFLEQLKEVE